MEIVKLIRENQLIYLNKETLIKELKKITGANIKDVKEEVENLILNGTLFVDDRGRISISRDRGYIKARLTLNKKGFGFASVEGKPDFFIPAYAINGAFDGDDVLVEITNMKTEDDIEAKVIKILARNTTHIVGTFVEGKSKNVVFPDDTKLPQIRIFKNDARGAHNNDKVYVEINPASLETKNLTGKIVEVLGQANTMKAEQLSIIRSFKLKDQFEKETLNEAKTLEKSVDYLKYKNKRADYTEHNTFTIDGEDARDFDDAISLKRHENGYVLYVHIADVSHYVKENSAIDKEAYRRGTSVYFPNHVIPMLPKELSNGICSLNENEYRLTLTVKMELDGAYNITNSAIVESIIKSKHRMTYTEITKIFEGDPLVIEKYADIYKDILTMREIANKFKADRLKQGEIRFNLPEPFILENSAGEIVSIEKRVQDEAHELIESFMVKANEIVAEWAGNSPFVYRVHEKPDSDKVAKLSDLLTNLGIANQLKLNGDQPVAYQQIVDRIVGTPKEKILSYLILRTMMKARYAPTCLGHFGLALTHYCHFTSPIRRYPDLLIHRIIKSVLAGTPKAEVKVHFEDVVERASIQASDTEKNADEAERAVDDYKKAVYMQKFLGEEFEGIISGVQEFGIFVELDNGIEGMIKTDYLPMDEYIYDEDKMSIYGKTHHYTIGDTVRVVVSNVNTQLRQIDFDLAGVEKPLKNFIVNKNKANKSAWDEKENSKNLLKNRKISSKISKKLKNSGKNSKKSKNSAKDYYKSKRKRK